MLDRNQFGRVKQTKQGWTIRFYIYVDELLILCYTTSMKYCTKCNRPYDTQYKMCDHCRLVKNKVSLARYHRIRKTVFDMYGGKCVCCGEANEYFLTLDHINGGGNQDRLKNGNKGTEIYKEIYKKGYRDDLQLLCMNCNFGKSRNKGICPHKGIISLDESYDIPEHKQKESKAIQVCIICGKQRSPLAGASVRCYEHRYTRLDGGSYNTDKPSKQKGTINIEEVHEK